MSRPTRCPRCGRENDPGLASCLDCGQPLRAAAPAPPAACASCGAPLRPGFRFCGACGKPAAPAPTARRAPGSAGVPGAAGAGAHQARRVPPPLPSGAAGSSRLRLTVVRNDGTPGTSCPVGRDPLVCGRTEGDLRLAGDPTVSPRHVRFTRAEGGLRAEDLGSVNGTFVRVRAPRRLSAGEELRVGHQVLRLEPLPRAAPADGAVRRWGSRDRGARFRLAQLLEGGGTGDVFPLHEGENVVGRDAGDVVFPADRYVSARHARVEVRGDAVTLVDAGSSNGTFVRLAGPVDLAPGDQLLVGGQLLRVDA